MARKKKDILSFIQKKQHNKTRKSKRQKNLGLAAPSASEMICRAASLLCCSPLTFIAPRVVFFLVHLTFPKLNGGRVAAEVLPLFLLLAPLCSSACSDIRSLASLCHHVGILPLSRPKKLNPANPE